MGQRERTSPTSDDLARPARDRGSTLVEVVVAVALMSIVIIPIINATATSVVASGTARKGAEIQTVLQSAADRVNRADPGCDYLSVVQAAVQAKQWTASQASVSYQYYRPGGVGGVSVLLADQGTWSAPGQGAIAACGGPTRQAHLVQLVTISITDTSGLQRTIQVVKSDV